MNLKRSYKLITLLILSLCLLTPFIFAIGSRLGAVFPFISGYEGLSYRFDSVSYQNYWYDVNHYTNPNYYGGQPASAHSFGERINFDPDASSTGRPNLHTEQMAFVVLPDTNETLAHWHVKVGETQTTEWYKDFQIDKYKAEWKINVWLDGTYNEAYPDLANQWRDAEVWIKVTPQDFDYFVDNPSQVFFAPAYMTVKEAKWYSGQNDGFQEDNSQAMKQDIFPETVGVAMGFYPTRSQISPVNPSQQALSYNGVLLDPQIFRDEYWIRLGIDTFGADSQLVWFGLGGWDWKYPSLQLTFETDVLVVGEWEVKLDKGEVIDLQPHVTNYDETGWTEFARGFFEFWNSPLGWFLGLTGLVMTIIILLAVFGVLTPVLGLLAVVYGGKKSKKG